MSRSRRKTTKVALEIQSEIDSAAPRSSKKWCYHQNLILFSSTIIKSRPTRRWFDPRYEMVLSIDIWTSCGTILAVSILEIMANQQLREDRYIQQESSVKTDCIIAIA
jgi:hypothetical protein